MTDIIFQANDQLQDVEDIGQATLSQAHIDELCTLRASVRGASEIFTTAIAEQAERCGIQKGALRRYIVAREADKLDSLDAEASDIANLLEITS